MTKVGAGGTAMAAHDTTHHGPRKGAHQHSVEGVILDFGALAHPVVPVFIHVQGRLLAARSP